MGYLHTAEINQYLVEVAYEFVKRSQLWDELQNAECDTTAEELAKVLGAKAEAWIEEREYLRLETLVAKTNHLDSPEVRVA